MSDSPELIQGDNAITINVRNRGLTSVGRGPVMSCLEAQYGYELGRTSQFSMSFPLRDPRTALLTSKSAIVDILFDGLQEYSGIIEARTIEVDSQGNLLLRIEGRDMAAELAESPVGFLTLTSASVGVTNGPALVLAAATTFKGVTWALDSVDGFTTTATAVYAKFAGESALQALIKIAEKIGEQWRVATDGSRQIVWLRAGTIDSGIRAVQTLTDPDAVDAGFNLCYIQSFSEREEAYQVYNTIYPHGSGIGGSDLTLEATTRTAPAGFTLDKTNNFIRNDTAIATDSPSGRGVLFKDIKPINPTDTDLQSAANTLFDSALAWLQRSDTVTDQKTYTLTCLNVPTKLKVGQTIRVEYFDDVYNVDAVLVVLGIRHQIGSSGARLTTLTVSAVSTWPAGDSEIVAQDMEHGQVFSSHTQTNANMYRQTSRVFVGYDQTLHKAEVPFWFGNETLQIDQVVIRIKVSPLIDFTVVIGGSAAVEIEVEVEVVTDDHTHTVPDHSHHLIVPEQSGPGVDSVNISHGVFPGSTIGYAGSSGQRNVFTNPSSGATTTPGGEGSATGTGTGTGTVDLSSAITSEFELHRADALDTFGANGLEWQVDGGGWALLSAATYLGPDSTGDWYLIDVTSLVRNSVRRPTAANHLLEIRHNRRTISSASVSAGVATIYMTSNHGLTSGQKVTITGTTNFNGTYTATVLAADVISFLHAAAATETAGAVAIHKTAMLDVFIDIRHSIQGVIIA